MPPIHDAALHGDLEKVTALLKENPDLVFIKDNHGRTPLYWATSKDMAELLLVHGADANAKTSDYGFSALMAASQKGHIEVVQALLDKGADINAKSNTEGNTALILASSNGHSEVVHALLDKGADIDAKGADGRTALQWASHHGYREVVQVLLAKGANPTDNVPSANNSRADNRAKPKSAERIGIIARMGCFSLSLVLFTAPIFCFVGAFTVFAVTLRQISEYAPYVVCLICLGMGREFWPKALKALLSAIDGRNLLWT